MLCIFTVQQLKPLKFELIISRIFDNKFTIYSCIFCSTIIVFASYENVLLWAIIIKIKVSNFKGFQYDHKKKTNGENFSKFWLSHAILGQKKVKT